MNNEPRTYDSLHMGRSSIDLYSNDVGAPFPEITSFAAYVGGSPTNISVGGRRLGLNGSGLFRRSGGWRRLGLCHFGRGGLDRLDRRRSGWRVRGRCLGLFRGLQAQLVATAHHRGDNQIGYPQVFEVDDLVHAQLIGVGGVLNELHGNSIPNARLREVNDFLHRRSEAHSNGWHFLRGRFGLCCDIGLRRLWRLHVCAGGLGYGEPPGFSPATGQEKQTSETRANKRESSAWRFHKRKQRWKVTGLAVLVKHPGSLEVTLQPHRLRSKNVGRASFINDQGSSGLVRAGGGHSHRTRA